MDSDALKERNYRQVELIRQLNAREQKRLDRNQKGIQDKCNWHIGQVSDEQKKIKAELVHLRHSTTKTWGFLPPRRDSKNLQPPSGMDQFEMEEYAKQLYKPKPKPVVPSIKAALNENEHYYNGQYNTENDEDDDDFDDIDGNTREEGNQSLRDLSLTKSPKTYRSSLAVNLKNVQGSISARLSESQSVSNSPVRGNSEKRSRSQTDRGPSRKRSLSLAAKETRHGVKERSGSLPPLDRNRQSKQTVAWDNVSTQSPESRVAPSNQNATTNDIVASKPPIHSTKRDYAVNNQKQVLSSKSEPILKQPVLHKKATNDPSTKNEQVITHKKVTNESSTKMELVAILPTAIKPSKAPNLPNAQTQNAQATNANETPKGPRALTPIKEMPMKERQPTNLSAISRRGSTAINSKQNPNPKSAKNKQAKNEEKKKSTNEKQADPNAFDNDRYNPDGSLRTVHCMPDFNESLEEALKARYLRSVRHKLPWEREISISEIWSDNNSASWNKITT